MNPSTTEEVFQLHLQRLGGINGVKQRLVQAIDGALRYLNISAERLNKMCGFGNRPIQSVAMSFPGTANLPVRRVAAASPLPMWSEISENPNLISSRAFSLAASALSVKIDAALSDVEITSDEKAVIGKTIEETQQGFQYGCGGGEVDAKEQAHLYLLLRLLQSIDEPNAQSSAIPAAA